MEWTEERVEKLTAMWEAGHSTKECAAALNVGRNAVIGKAHRLGLKKRPNPIIPTWTADEEVKLTRLWHTDATMTAIARIFEKDRSSIRGKAHRMGLPPRTWCERAKPEPPQHIGEIGSRSCQWIEGEPSADDACKCGAPALKASAYCPEHNARCWRAKTL